MDSRLVEIRKGITVKTQYILVSSCETILGARAKELLSIQRDMEVTSVNGDDSSRILELINANPFAVVILVDYMPDQMTSQIRKILSDFPETKLVTLSVDDNWIHVVQERKVLLNQVMDLPKVIRSLGKEERLDR